MLRFIKSADIVRQREALRPHILEMQHYYRIFGSLKNLLAHGNKDDYFVRNIGWEVSDAKARLAFLGASQREEDIMLQEERWIMDNLAPQANSSM